MKTTESNLLKDVLGERSSAPDTLGPMLRAVRARRRCRYAVPAAALLLVGVLAWAFWERPEPQPGVAATEILPVPMPPPAAFERVFTIALSPEQRVTTAPGHFITRVRTAPDLEILASDRELLAWAGGRGVGIFRHGGRMELRFAPVY